MQVDLLHPETESLTPCAEGLHPHPQHLLIESAGCLNVYHRKDKVINSLNYGTPPLFSIDQIIISGAYIVNLDSAINIL